MALTHLSVRTGWNAVIDEGFEETAREVAWVNNRCFLQRKA